METRGAGLGCEQRRLEAVRDLIASRDGFIANTAIGGDGRFGKVCRLAERNQVQNGKIRLGRRAADMELRSERRPGCSTLTAACGTLKKSPGSGRQGPAIYVSTQTSLVPMPSEAAALDLQQCPGRFEFLRELRQQQQDISHGAEELSSELQATEQKISSEPRTTCSALTGRDGMDTALPPGMKGWSARKGPSRTEGRAVSMPSRPIADGARLRDNAMKADVQSAFGS